VLAGAFMSNSSRKQREKHHDEMKASQSNSQKTAWIVIGLAVVGIIIAIVEIALQYEG